MRGRRTADRARAAAEERLARVARQWLPPGDPSAVVTGAAGLVAPAPTRLRWGPWSRSAVRALVLLVAAAVAVAGYGAWHSRPRAVATPAILATGAPVTGLASPTAPAASTPPSSAPASTAAVVAPPAAEVVVHVAGLVRRPGLVRLPAGSRVADAVTAAGGVTKPRAADSVNLARLLVDGEQIVVSTTPSTPSDQVSTVNPGAPMVLDLNTATAEALDTLPGVGPVLAARIISWRDENGPFRSVEELGEVSGIGEAILGQVRDLVRV